MKINKLGQYLLLSAASVALMSCNHTSAPKASLSNQLAFGSASSIAMVSSLNSGKAMVSKALAPMPDAKKEEVKAMLPSLDAIFASRDDMASEIVASDRAGFEKKQIITISDLNPSENEVYTLYFNVTASGDTDNVEDDLPKNADEIVFDTLVAKTSSKDEKDDDDELDRDGQETSTATVIQGLAIADSELEYKFAAISTEEVESEETEKKFALRMFKENNSYVDVVHESEVEEGESETEYKYTLVENGVVVRSFEVETEVEVDGKVQENELEITVNGETFEYEISERDGSTFIEVEYKSADQEYAKVLFKKVVVDNEDGTTSVSFEEVL